MSSSTTCSVDVDLDQGVTNYIFVLSPENLFRCMAIYENYLVDEVHLAFNIAGVSLFMRLCVLYVQYVANSVLCFKCETTT